MFGFEPYSGIRLGKEVGQLVRFFGIGGVFHSDELPNYGINDSDVDKVRKHLELADGDGFSDYSWRRFKVGLCYRFYNKENSRCSKMGFQLRLELLHKTVKLFFLDHDQVRQECNPETDIPSISVMPEEVKLARENIPKSWDDSIAEIQQKYDLNFQLSEQIF